MVDPQIAAANAAAIVSAGNAIGAGLAMTGMIGAGSERLRSVVSEDQHADFFTRTIRERRSTAHVLVA